MAEENKNSIKVIFEAYIGDLKNKLKEAAQGIVELGQQGKKSGEAITQGTAEAAAGVKDLGEQGDQAGSRFNKGLQTVGAALTWLQKKLDGVAKQIKNKNSVLDKGFRSAENAAERLYSKLNKLSKILTVGFVVKKTVGAISAFLNESTSMAQAAAENHAKLALVMRKTMDATDEEIESVVALSKAWEEQGVVSATAQQNALAELATFAEESDTIKRMLPVMNDYIAYQYGVSASQENARQVATALGKAMQGQFDALSEQGFKFDELQRDILKYGTEADKASVLIEAIGESMGGTNKALAALDTGKMASLATIVDNVKIRIGTMANEATASIAGNLLPVVSDLANRFLTALDAAMETAKASGIFDHISEAIGILINTVGELIIQFVENAPEALTNFGSMLQWIAENAEHLFDLIVMGIQIWLSFKVAITAVNLVTNWLPTLIGLVISALVILYTKSETARRVIKTAFESIKLAVLNFAKIFISKIRDISEAIAALAGDIPIIGEAAINTAKVASKAMSIINEEIDKTEQNLQDLAEEAKNANSDLEELDGSEIDMEVTHEMALPEEEDLAFSPSKETLELINNAKNKTVDKISNTTSAIKENLDKMVGAFNMPSELTPLTQYAHMTTNNAIVTRVVNTPTLNMTLNVKDLGSGSAAEVRNKLNNFTEHLFGKDSLLGEGWGDIKRNL